MAKHGLKELFGCPDEEGATGRRRQAKRLRVIDLKAVFNQLSESLHRELDFGQEASNIERMRDVLAGYDRLGAPAVHKDLSAARFLVMEEIQGIPIARAPEGPERTEAARQLLESFYKQIIADGFFHADPHPGNLMWWKDKIYFLDLGMVGTLDADLREQLMLLLMAFWKEDAGFLTDVALMLSGRFDSSQLDMTRFQAEIGGLMAKYRTAGLAEMQVGPILQEMSEIALRHGVPLPASLTLIGKALAQVQLATAQLDPTLDPFEVAGTFLTRSLLQGMRSKIDPKTLLYESQKLKTRALRMLEAPLDSYALISDADAQHGDGSCASRNSVDPGAKVGRTSDCERARRRRGRMKEEIRTRYWAPLEGRHESGAWEVLDAGYREGQRAYHTWAYRRLAGKARRAVASRHPRRHRSHGHFLARRGLSDAERGRQSAARSRECLRQRRIVSPIYVVGHATADHLRAEAETQHYVGFSDDLALFLDMDFSSLGSPWAEFVDNLANIRFEFSWMSEPLFRSTHVPALESFAEKARLYRRAETSAKWEAAAKSNLTRCLAELKGGVTKLSW